MKNANILLEDGTILEGEYFGADKTVMGEIVFNTGMTGYQEILTDPSYAGQIVVMTYPLIGNYGVNDKDIESDRIKVSGFIVKEYCDKPSHWQSKKNLQQYLIENNIPAICNIDTRMLTKKIRDKGTMKCLITSEKITDKMIVQLQNYVFPKNIVKQVSESKKEVFGEGSLKIALIDLGVKRSIIKQLIKRDCEVHVFPWNVGVKEILNGSFNAVLFSNGPGDPKDANEVIETAKKLIGEIPLYGICLGHQILALALGADTYKLKFGHRGSNHPIQQLSTNKVFISSQNHGYAVNENSLNSNMKTTFINVNDETIEGFKSNKYNINTVQFHPEESPGPEDAHIIFDEWLDDLKEGV